MAKGITINEALRRIEKTGFDSGMCGAPYCTDTEAAKTIFGALKKRNKPGRFSKRNHTGGLRLAVASIKNLKPTEIKTSPDQITADEIQKLSLTIKIKTLSENDCNEIVRTIYAGEIASLLRAQGFSRIFSWHIKHPSIKEIGMYKVKVTVSETVSTFFSLWVVPLS